MVDPIYFWIATVIFVVITIYLSYLGYKRTRQGEEYLLAGRNVNPIIIGLSYGATFISTSAIVGFGGVAAIFGMSIIWLVVLNVGIGVLLAFLVFGHPVRRLGKKLGAVTFPDLMSKVYRSDFIRYFMAVVILIGMPLYSAAVLIGGSRFIEGTLDVDFDVAMVTLSLIVALYVAFGGMRAVMYADAFQALVMILGMGAILVITFSLLGGVTEANTALSNLANDPGVPAPLAAQGMTGWTSFPEFLSQNWYFMVTTIIMGVGIGVLAQPQLIVRFMCAKDGKMLNRAIPVGGLFILLTTGVAYTVGALSNVYFMDPDNGGALSSVIAGDRDKIMPLYIESAMPDIVVVFFLLTLLAAAMSTLSSLLHALGSAAGTDLWSGIRRSRLVPEKYRRPKEDNTCSLRSNRYAAFLMIAVTLAVAFYMPNEIIAIATSAFMGLCASAFLPMFAAGVFIKRPSVIAAKLSLAVGALTWFIWGMFVYGSGTVETKWSGYTPVFGVCQALFDKASVLPTPYSWIDPLFVALPLATLMLIIGYAVDRNRKVEKEENQS
ncbi:MAG: sodium:solute symporter family protein [Methanomassiliicoccales archaeon]|nr:MAG: sodium:solute symporter family protein [Methanomassiliicoccales archaeon]